MALRQLAVVLALFVCSSRCAFSDETRGLQAFVGRDLLKLTPGEFTVFADSYRKITHESRPNQRGEVFPWVLETFNTHESRWILVEVYPGYDVPDASYVQIHLFDSKWQRVLKQRCPVGYRLYIWGVKVTLVRETNEPLLEISVSHEPNELPIADPMARLTDNERLNFERQYYGSKGHEMALVGVFNREGIVRNYYGWRQPFRGPALLTDDANEWNAMFLSCDRATVLSALVWLTGDHLSSEEPRHAGVNQEGVAESRLFEMVRTSDRTRIALETLSQSDDSWISAYAKLALRLRSSRDNSGN